MYTLTGLFTCYDSLIFKCTCQWRPRRRTWGNRMTLCTMSAILTSNVASDTLFCHPGLHRLLIYSLLPSWLHILSPPILALYILSLLILASYTFSLHPGFIYFLPPSWPH